MVFGGRLGAVQSSPEPSGWRKDKTIVDAPWRSKKGRLRTRRRLFFTAEFVQPFLHFVELPLELVHFAARTLRFFCRL